MYAAEINEMIKAPRATALEYFTPRGMEEGGRRRAAMEEEMEVPASVAD